MWLGNQPAPTAENGTASRMMNVLAIERVFRGTTCRRSAVVVRLQHDDGFHHRERSRIGGRLRATGLPHHRLDFGELFDDLVLRLEQTLRFGDGDAR